ARKPFTVSGNYIPRRVLGRGVADGVFIDLEEFLPQSALLDVVEIELPSLVGIVDASQQALELFVLGDIEKELDGHGAAAGEMQFEIVDVLVGLGPEVVGHELRRQ